MYEHARTVWPLVIVSLVLIITSRQVSCDTFHIVRPLSTTPCPGKLTGEPCLTLEEFVRGDYENYVSNPTNVTLNFESGEHNVLRILSNVPLLISNLDFFAMKSESNSARISLFKLEIRSVKEVKISGITFDSCVCEVESVTNLSIESSTFHGTTRQFGFSQRVDYQALNITKSSAVVKDCTFSANNAAFGSVNSSVTIDRSAFIDNGATSGDNVPVSVDGGSLDVFNTTFTGNTAYSGSGGALAVQNMWRAVTICGCNFTNNQADTAGGALFSSSSLSIYQTTFLNNSVNSLGQRFPFYNPPPRYLGGAVFVADTNSSITVSKSSFIHNTVLSADGKGGAIYSDEKQVNVSITDSLFSHNVAAYCGAIDFDGYHQNVKLSSSLFTYNAALNGTRFNDDNGGGVACLRKASITVTGSSFSDNSAAGNAGVFAVDESELFVEKSVFNNNTAEASGGVIATEFFHTKLSIRHTVFTNNEAGSEGGVMFVARKGSQVKINESAFSFNSASSGGVAHILGSSLEMTSTHVSNNAASLGQVVYACNSNIALSNDFLNSTHHIYPECRVFNGATDSNETDAISKLLSQINATKFDNYSIPDEYDGSLCIPQTTTTDVETTTTTAEPSITSVHFELNGIIYPNNSIISLSSIGVMEQALMCKTDLTTCCGTPPNRMGEFYYPNGAAVSVSSAGHAFYRDRKDMRIRLNRRDSVQAPTGRFRCDIPDASGTIQVLYVFLIAESE